jgi:hypothetical protein
MRAATSNALYLDAPPVPCPARDRMCRGALAYAMLQWLVASYGAVYVGLAQAALQHALGYLKREGTRECLRASVPRTGGRAGGARQTGARARREADQRESGGPETNRVVY